VETVYKVTWLQDSRHFSIFPPIGLEIEYIPGEITRPMVRNSYLLAFNTLASARGFCFNETYDVAFTLWRAEAKVEGLVWRLSPVHAQYDSISDFWKNASWMYEAGKATIPRHSFLAPRGTVACSQITLIAPVQ